MRVCVDYRNLNEATLKDEYPMPMADMLIDGAAHNKILTFMVGNAGYNQIMVAEVYIHKTAFRCPRAVRAYEYIFLSFGLKNAGATYQRVMNSIFHDMIGHTLEVYIDEVVIKSQEQEAHIEDLRKAFIRMRQHQFKINPKKCAFGVQAGNFLGFLVHQRGKVQPFSPLLKIKQGDPFVWGPIQQEAFDQIKQYLSNPPFLMPPRKGILLKLYISASENSIGSLLAQDNMEGKGQAVFYLSRILQDVETCYSAIEKLCLALYFTVVKLRHYMLPFTVHIIAKTDLIKHMLNRPVLRGRLGKRILALSEFSFRYVPQKAIKGQAIADFLAAHPCVEIEDLNTMGIANIGFSPDQRAPKFEFKSVPGNLLDKRGQVQIPVKTVQIKPWKLYFNGSKTESAASADIVIEEPFGAKYAYSFQLDFDSINNIAEYEALIIGLEMILELSIKQLEVFGDSQLVIKQLTNEYKCMDPNMAAYYVAACNLSSMFKTISIKYIPRDKNLAANQMAQIAFSIQIQEHQSKRTTKCRKAKWPDSTYSSRPLNPIIKPRPFRGWAMDFVGKIAPSFSNEHTFTIIVATDYFTKRAFAEEYNIKFVQSSPYFPRANGQAESTNKVLINIIKKIVDNNPRDWHERLSKALWADRTSKKTAKGTAPFALTYGHDIVLPVEINVQSLRTEKQPDMSKEEYAEDMMKDLEQLSSI
ncbi:hypothetical protein L3X38_024289 [Prunus dulcis]|uniref:RNase H type-1 domain-containing protein n=1 Tax=Prunus dulcis TaxID=3755 RepID=A0AAD4W224_PRUDU|nr:hypothetical protein L3X38_024289 [Prunus dulcis]